jgi:hypothetical protein
MDGSGNLLREFVWGAGADEPLVWWEGPGPKMFHTDERGSIISVADSSGNVIADQHLRRIWRAGRLRAPG